MGNERSVLVIDDSPFALQSVRRWMEREGWSVRTAVDARTALDDLRAQVPDVVVCDLHMPDIDGLGVIRAIADFPSPRPPVIVVSGDENLSAVLEAVRAGAFDYVVKSADLREALLVAADRAWRHLEMIRRNLALAAELDQRVADLEHEVRSRRAAEDALRVARDEAVAANRAKGVFLTNMSHELRTPLNAILGYSALLLEDADEDPERSADLRKIASAGRHLLSLIEDVLDLAKVDAGHLRLTLGPVRVAPVVADAVATVARAVSDQGNHLSVEVSGDPVVCADELRLRQCLLNLLANAAKFTNSGTIAIRVVPETGEVGQAMIAIAIHDTGIGMTAEQAGRVFLAFEQADESTARKFGGTGLGLAITSHLVAQMRGTLGVESSPGVGSTFTLCVPSWVGAST